MSNRVKNGQLHIPHDVVFDWPESDPVSGEGTFWVYVRSDASEEEIIQAIINAMSGARPTGTREH